MVFGQERSRVQCLGLPASICADCAWEVCGGVRCLAGCELHVERFDTRAAIQTPIAFPSWSLDAPADPSLRILQCSTSLRATSQR